MANNIFGLGGGLGGALSGLMSGLAKTGLVPTDTPEGKLLNAQSTLTDLQKQETALLLEIGRQAYAQNPGAWPQDANLKLIRQNMAAADAALAEAQQSQKAAEKAKAEEDAKGRCPQCSHKNPEGLNFCQECGASLAASAGRHCTTCGLELAAGVRFCGSCGARQEV